MGTTATYHGTCPECLQPIIPGQQIESVDGAWEHVRCGTLARTAPCVCERCMTVHAGVC